MLSVNLERRAALDVHLECQAALSVDLKQVAALTAILEHLAAQTATLEYPDVMRVVFQEPPTVLRDLVVNQILQVIIQVVFAFLWRVVSVMLSLLFYP